MREKKKNVSERCKGEGKEIGNELHLQVGKNRQEEENDKRQEMKETVRK